MPRLPADASGQIPPPRRVPDHLFRCLVAATVFPFTGWLALRHSWRVNHRLAAGDVEGARRERRLALRWYWLSLVFLLALLTAAFVIWSRHLLTDALGPG